MSAARPPLERFLAKIDFAGDCWLWTGAIVHGYGRFAVSGRIVLAHRWSHEFFVGPIPDGLVLDHVKARGCGHCHCVNPDHLEPVTTRENVLRGSAPSAANAHKAYCKNGHPFDDANTYLVPAGRRRACKICDRANGARYRAKKRAA